MYSFGYISLLITTLKCLCPDDVILMPVERNISAAFDWYSGLTINIVLLLGFGKYPYFGPTAKRSFHQRRNFYNFPGLVKSSEKATVLGSL